MKKKPIKVIVEEGKFFQVTGTFSVRSEDMFAENAKYLPVLVFVHSGTGEVKLFSKIRAGEVGTQKILKTLNS
jgi:hypothetical protein